MRGEITDTLEFIIFFSFPQMNYSFIIKNITETIKNIPENIQNGQTKKAKQLGEMS